MWSCHGSVCFSLSSKQPHRMLLWAHLPHVSSQSRAVSCQAECPHPGVLTQAQVGDLPVQAVTEDVKSNAAPDRCWVTPASVVWVFIVESGFSAPCD